VKIMRTKEIIKEKFNYTCTLKTVSWVESVLKRWLSLALGLKMSL